LVLMFVTTFHVWNLVLGVYVRQIVMISADNEIELEMHHVHDGEEKVRWVQKILEDSDVDKDGCISLEELESSLKANNQLVKEIGLDAHALESLHSSLEESNGKVVVGDLLFGVMKLKGLSRTLDMLSVDFRQNALHRGISSLERSSHITLDTLTADLDVLQRHMEFFNEKIIQLLDTIKQAKGDLLAEAERLRKATWRLHRFAIQSQHVAEERRRKDNLEKRHKYESQIDILQAQVDRLSQERNMTILAMAGPKDIEQLRRTVQQRLDTEVGAWLETTLAEATAG